MRASGDATTDPDGESAPNASAAELPRSGSGPGDAFGRPDVDAIELEAVRSNPNP